MANKLLGFGGSGHAKDVISAEASIAKTARIGLGTFIGAFAYIGMGCQITESIHHQGIRLIPKPNYIAARG